MPDPFFNRLLEAAYGADVVPDKTGPPEGGTPPELLFDNLVVWQGPIPPVERVSWGTSD